MLNIDQKENNKKYTKICGQFYKKKNVTNFNPKNFSGSS